MAPPEHRPQNSSFARLTGRVRPRVLACITAAEQQPLRLLTNRKTSKCGTFETLHKKVRRRQDRLWADLLARGKREREAAAAEPAPQPVGPPPAEAYVVLAVLGWSDGGGRLRLLLGPGGVEAAEAVQEVGRLATVDGHHVVLVPSSSPSSSACGPGPGLFGLPQWQLPDSNTVRSPLLLSPVPALQAVLAYARQPEVHSRLTQAEQQVLHDVLDCTAAAHSALALLLAHQACHNAETKGIIQALLLHFSHPGSGDSKACGPLTVPPSAARATSQGGGMFRVLELGLPSWKRDQGGALRDCSELWGPGGVLAAGRQQCLVGGGSRASGAPAILVPRVWEVRDTEEAELWRRCGLLGELEQRGLLEGRSTGALAVTPRVWEVLLRLCFLLTARWPDDCLLAEWSDHRPLKVMKEVWACLTLLAKHRLGLCPAPYGWRWCTGEPVGLSSRCFTYPGQVQHLLDARLFRFKCARGLWSKPPEPPSWFKPKVYQVVTNTKGGAGLRWRNQERLLSDQTRLQPSRGRDMVVLLYSATRQHVIGLHLCIKGLSQGGTLNKGCTEERELALKLCSLLLDDAVLRPFTANMRRELWTTRLRLHKMLHRHGDGKRERLRLMWAALHGRDEAGGQRGSSEAEEVVGGDRYVMERQLHDLAKKLGDTTPEMTRAARKPEEPRTTFVRACRVDKLQPGAGRRVYEGGLNVEQVALEHFASEEGFSGAHCERRLYLLLLDLLLHHQIQDGTVPGAYASPLWSLPLDRHFASFYSRRKQQLDDRFHSLEQLCEACEDEGCALCHQGSHPCRKTRLFHEVARAWDEQRGSVKRWLAQHYCSWLTKRQACEIAAGLGRTLVIILSILVKDLNAYRSGLPDLILWAPADRAAFATSTQSSSDHSETPTQEAELPPCDDALPDRHTTVAVAPFTPPRGLQGWDAEDEDEEVDGESAEMMEALGLGTGPRRDQTARGAVAVLTTGSGHVSWVSPRARRFVAPPLGLGGSQAWEEEEEDMMRAGDEGDGGGPHGATGHEDEDGDEAVWMRELCRTRFVARLVEVKSPTDELSPGQSNWHRLLIQRAAPHRMELCRVQVVED